MCCTVVGAGVHKDMRECHLNVLGGSGELQDSSPTADRQVVATRLGHLVEVSIHLVMHNSLQMEGVSKITGTSNAYIMALSCLLQLQVSTSHDLPHTRDTRLETSCTHIT